MAWTDDDRQALRALTARSKKRGFVMTGAEQALVFKAAREADAKNAREGQVNRISAVGLANGVMKAEGYDVPK